MEKPLLSTNQQKPTTRKPLPPQQSRWHNFSDPTYGRWLIRVAFYEFFGSFVLVLIQMASGESLIRLGASAGVNDIFAHGLAGYISAFMVAHVSGAVLNPALSLGLFFTGRLDFVSFIVYSIVQVCGGIAATGLFRLAMGSTVHNLGLPTLLNGISVWNGFWFEVMLGFIMMFYFAMIMLRGRWFWYKNGWHFHHQHPPRTSQLGLTSFAWNAGVEAAVVTTISSGPNPIRWLGPAVLRRQFQNWQVWILGPYVGVLLALPFYLLDAALLRPERRNMMHQAKHKADEEIINYTLANPEETPEKAPPPPYSSIFSSSSTAEPLNSPFISTYASPWNSVYPPNRPRRRTFTPEGKPQQNHHRRV